ncbi:hypothetical protein [Microcoleus sp. S36bC1]|uniref:hypothetical protein n=1 Tax=Microcoleus sp. S36bC1 TaxID=2818945 RepID=UPI002FD51E96
MISPKSICRDTAVPCPGDGTAVSLQQSFRIAIYHPNATGFDVISKKEEGS